MSKTNDKYNITNDENIETYTAEEIDLIDKLHNFTNNTFDVK